MNDIILQLLKIQENIRREGNSKKNSIGHKF